MAKEIEIPEGCEARIEGNKVIPELKESEDERIRKNLIELLLDTPAQDIISHNLELSKVLAYLEKQKEQKPAEDWREKRKEECPFRRNLDNNLYGCERYADVISACTGACSWVVDYPKLKEIQDKKEQKPNPSNSVGLEQKPVEPDWCHHKVDLSGHSEEYVKAYYDGWNNCNQQHAQCEAEQKPVDEQFPPLEGLDKIKAKYYDDGFKNGFDEGVESVKSAEWSEKCIADIFEKVGLAKIVREQGNDALINAIQSAMIELSKVRKI